VSHSNDTLTDLVVDGIEVTNTYQCILNDSVANIDGKLLGRKIPVYIVAHHVSHCASVFYTSGVDEAWCFSMDSSHGSVEANSLIMKGSGNKLEIVDYPGMMIGVGYSVFTQGLNLGDPVHKAGSTMGLASYGKPHRDVVENIEKYIKESYFINDSRNYADYYFQLWEKFSNSPTVIQRPDSPTGLMLAATIQYLFEQCTLDVVKKYIGDKTENLCLSGGSFLNCNANSLIKNSTNYKNIFHFPACGDDGIAIGAALYVAHAVFDEKRHSYTDSEICYLGKNHEYQDIDYSLIAKEIADGKIVGWFMGASEYGPRALGNRSILADPRDFHVREKLNFVVKNREWFRPFAPSVLEEEADKWFDFKGKSPFMLYTANVLQPKEIPAVTHVDGTARLQTVTESLNRPYYKLIKEFQKITGVPMLVNTSLNGNGEPILESEFDAVKFLENSNVDLMVINGKIVYK